MELLISIAIYLILWIPVQYWSKKTDREMAARRNQFPQAKR